jgi:LysR family nitrogen assimilation transcriptional regulator
LDLRQLKYFVAVARAGSFIAAGRKLNMSQPALGYQIKKLENALGVELLQRLPRGVLPTPAGNELLVHAEAILQRLTEANTAIAVYRATPHRSYVFGVTPTSGQALLPDLLDLCGNDPGLKIALREGLSVELISQITAGQLDMGVCYNPRPHPNMVALPLLREDLFLIGPSDLIGGNTTPIAFAGLSAFPLVLDTRFQLTRGLIERAAQEHGVRLNVTVEAESTNFKRELLVMRRCCTVASYGLFLPEINAGILRGRHIVAPSIDRTLSLIGRPGLPNGDFEFMRTALAPIIEQKIAEGRFCWHSL